MKRFFKTKKSQRIKTLVLGLGALLAIIYGLIFIVGIPAREVFVLLSVSVLIVFILAVAGFIASFSFLWLRRKFRTKKP